MMLLLWLVMKFGITTDKIFMRLDLLLDIKLSSKSSIA